MMPPLVNQPTDAVMTYLSLGSNVGNRKQHLSDALHILTHDSHAIFDNIICSPIYESPALLKEGAPEEWNQPFLNMVIGGTTTYSAAKILETIQYIEKALQRERLGAWSPRTMDVDILLYGNQIISTDTLTIPHPEMHKRDFVLIPLRAIAPDITMPEGSPHAGASIQTLVDSLQDQPSLHVIDGTLP